MSPFEQIGLPFRLEVSVEEVDAALRGRAKMVHPDVGGDAMEFAELSKAAALLRGPASRLKAALEVTGVESVERGAVPGVLMDYFSPVAGVLEEVSAFLLEREGTRSVLGRALCDAKVPVLKARLEGLVEDLERLEERILGSFAEFDQRGWELCVCEMEETYRALLFLAKWLAQLRGAVGKIFEVLLAG